MSENGEMFDDNKLTIERVEFDNYKQKQNYYKLLFNGFGNRM